jgi:hypothetical protein
MKERGRIEPSSIEPIVERVVGQVLDSHAAQLRTEIVRRVMEEIAAAPAEPTSSDAASAPADLARAVAEIQMGTSQREILRALLDTSSRYAARVALFVVKGSHATGWQGRGFAHDDAVKDFVLDENAPAVIRAIDRAIGRTIGDNAVASVPVADLDAHFLQVVGTPASGEGRILPLILKEKVAALVYADSGTEAVGTLDAGALELLVLSTSAWLEVNSLRKQARTHSESPSVPTGDAPLHQAPIDHATVQCVPAFNDPFASYVPGHAMAAAASAHEAAASVASSAVESAQAEPLPTGHSATQATPGPLPDSSTSALTEDQEVHRKAQRFARLLADEIKLYNQAKVAEGRKHQDLYDRLKDAIEKSRATYQKRYGNTVAASGNYFQHEIIRSLAEDDVSIMGANFRQ